MDLHIGLRTKKNGVCYIPLNLCKKIMKLLQNKKAIKPIYDEERYGDYLPHCRNCKKVLPNNAVYGKANFCYYCGQAVK